MTRTIAVTLLFFSTFSCFVGCATTPEPKKVENKLTEWAGWRELPFDPNIPGQKSLKSLKVDAVVSFNFYPANIEISKSLEEAGRALDNCDGEINETFLSDDGQIGTFNFDCFATRIPTSGIATIVSVDRKLPVLLIFGAWPTELDDESVAAEYENILKQITHKMKFDKDFKFVPFILPKK